MPVFFRYHGFRFFIYANEHEPPHVHVEKAGKEIKVEYYIQGGRPRQRQIKIRGKFSPAEASDIADFAREYRPEIISKRNEFFVLKVPVKNELINKIRKKKTVNGD
jgi:Domain of unknown function (DUF4160)